MRRVATVLAALALVLALGGWTRPQQLETAPVHEAALQGDGHGHRVAAWVTDTAVRVAVAEKGRDFGPALTLARAGGPYYGLQLAVGPRGDALVVWSLPTRQEVRETGQGCCIPIRAALVSRSGRVTGPVTVASPVADGIRSVVAAGTRGRFGIAWSTTNPKLRFARLASIRRGFGAVERVPGGGLYSSLTFDNAGARVLSVVDLESLQEVSRDDAGRWSRPRSLLHRPYLEGALAGADALGRQVFVVVASSGRDTRLGQRKPPGPLVQSALVPDPPDPAPAVIPSLAVAWSGAAVVAWPETFGPWAPSDVLLRLRRPGRPFGPVDLVYQAPNTSLDAAAVAPDGSAALGLEVGSYPKTELRVVRVWPGGEGATPAAGGGGGPPFGGVPPAPPGPGGLSFTQGPPTPPPGAARPGR